MARSRFLLGAMGLRFKILGSSSSGNCALLVTDNSRILIDAGFSGKRIGEMLEEAGESLDGLDAVFLTHEHSDHVKGVPGLIRYRRDLPVFANRGTAEAVNRRLRRRACWQLFQTGSRFAFRDLAVEAFTIPHDAYDPVGFTFSTGDGEDLFSPCRKLAWVTDLGYAPDLVREKIRDVDLLVLESNHCVKLLQESGRPWSLKQRIAGRHGHLSNEAARDLLASVANPGWQRVFLAHLSDECNSLEAVRGVFSLANGHGGESKSANGNGYAVEVIASGAGSGVCEVR